MSLPSIKTLRMLTGDSVKFWNSTPEQTGWTVLRTGMLAYYETTFHGMLPCKVVSIGPRSDTDSRPTFRIKLTATRKAYKRGEILQVDSGVIPRKCVSFRKFKTYTRPFLVDLDGSPSPL